MFFKKKRLTIVEQKKKGSILSYFGVSEEAFDEIYDEMKKLFIKEIKNGDEQGSYISLFKTYLKSKAFKNTKLKDTEVNDMFVLGFIFSAVVGELKEAEKKSKFLERMLGEDTDFSKLLEKIVDSGDDSELKSSSLGNGGNSSNTIN